MTLILHHPINKISIKHFRFFKFPWNQLYASPQIALRLFFTPKFMLVCDVSWSIFKTIFFLFFWIFLFLFCEEISVAFFNFYCLLIDIQLQIANLTGRCLQNYCRIAAFHIYTIEEMYTSFGFISFIHIINRI